MGVGGAIVPGFGGDGLVGLVGSLVAVEGLGFMGDFGQSNEIFVAGVLI